MERKPSIPDEELKTVALAVLRILKNGKSFSVNYILGQLKYFGFKGYDRRKLRIVRKYINHSDSLEQVVVSGNFGYKIAASEQDREDFYERMGSAAKDMFMEIHACKSKPILPVDIAPGPLFKGVNNG
jgi:hypothetical protein